ncbi:MAG: hypothetical protein HPY69_06795 [Armatimonadetes bacterium]|nr:hypothetical protein [Armatimonadota bacterium]
MRTLFVVSLLAILAASLAAGQPVPRVTRENPVAGFSVTIPEDWVMTTGPGGNLEIALDAASGASLALSPALWFFNAPQPPAQEAKALARALELLGNGAKPIVAATGNGDEWELQMTSDGARGPVRERWLCRTERGRSFVVGAMARPEVYEAGVEDVKAALASFRLIPTVSLTFLREPTENAYRMTLPSGWRWEGQIFRSELVPGYFVWQVAAPDGLTGAFTAQPGTFNITVPYCPAGQAAETIILPYLEQKVPGLRLAGVHELPRSAQAYMAAIRALGLGSQPRVDRVFADYSGTVGGTPIRMRLDVVTWMLDQSPLLGGLGNWILVANGVWGPEANFAQAYALGQGVIASVKTDPRWRANQFRTVNDVLNYRNQVMDRIGMDWDAWIRDHEPVPDPNTGERKEVPIGDGDPWFDKDGKPHRVPPDQEQAAKDKGWNRAPR